MLDALRFREVGLEVACEKLREVASAQVDRPEHSEHAVLDDANRGLFVTDVDQADALPIWQIKLRREVVEGQAVDVDELWIDVDALQMLKKAAQEVLARHHGERDRLIVHRAEDLVID